MTALLILMAIFIGWLVVSFGIGIPPTQADALELSTASGGQFNKRSGCQCPATTRSFGKTTSLVSLLRWSIVFVGVFSFMWSLLFKQTEYILMYFAITGAI